MCLLASNYFRIVVLCCIGLCLYNELCTSFSLLNLGRACRFFSARTFMTPFYKLHFTYYPNPASVPRRGIARHWSSGTGQARPAWSAGCCTAPGHRRSRRSETRRRLVLRQNEQLYWLYRISLVGWKFAFNVEEYKFKFRHTRVATHHHLLALSGNRNNVRSVCRWRQNNIQKN